MKKQKNQKQIMQQILLNAKITKQQFEETNSSLQMHSLIAHK